MAVTSPLGRHEVRTALPDPARHETGRAVDIGVADAAAGRFHRCPGAPDADAAFLCRVQAVSNTGIHQIRAPNPLKAVAKAPY